MSLCSIRCFGVGDGLANADRNHSSYLYQFAGNCVLIDCGEPVARSFKASGLSYDLIDHIFISHLHSDHFAGFLMLLQTFWLEKRTKQLRVHLPSDAIAPVQQLLRSVYLFEDLLPFKLLFEPLKKGETIKVGNAQITAFPTTHLEQLRARFQSRYPGDYQAFCFLIESDGARIAHSCDIGAPEDLAPLLGKPIDLLVCELSHFTPEALFKYLRGREIRKLALIHIGRPLWADLKKVEELARNQLPGMQISIPRDGTILECV